MNWINATLKEIVGLFVDDESLAAMIVVWLILFGVLAITFPNLRIWGGLLLFAGLALVLAHSALKRSGK